jgi:hypothetical protein
VSVLVVVVVVATALFGVDSILALLMGWLIP